MNKILLNAESFGFGPTSAIAQFFPNIRKRFEFVGYIGESLSMDLQNKLPYDEVYNSTNLEESRILEIMKGYQIFFTALDFRMAEIAKKAGLKVVIYDPLTWYWSMIPDIVYDCDLYLSQNFFGVKERLDQDRNKFTGKFRIIPNISKKKDGGDSSERDLVLINFGGLRNPHFLDSTQIKYVKNILPNLLNILGDEKVVVAGNSVVAEELSDLKIKCLTHNEMEKILPQVKLAFMTSGLGNIFDSARYSMPTIWLPPANDSQGQQLELLKERDILDADLDWRRFSNSIDYGGVQLKVLSQIEENIINFEGSSAKFQKSLSEAYLKVRNLRTSKTSKLVELFGVGGVEEVVDALMEI